jgi:hypothetical protein
VGRVFYEGHREVVLAWQGHAIALYERWKWTPAVVEQLDVPEFVFYVEQAGKMYEMEREALEG